MAQIATTGPAPRIPDGTLHCIDFETFVRLGELGIYPTRSELIDGIVYDMSPKGDPHYFAQAKLIEQLSDRARYARAGVREYWVVDLQHESIERYVPAGAVSASARRKHRFCGRFRSRAARPQGVT